MNKREQGYAKVRQIKFANRFRIKTFGDIIAICLASDHCNNQTNFIDLDNKQCHANARRTVKDIYLLTRTYLSKPVSLSNVIKTLNYLERSSNLEITFCGTINRRVHHCSQYRTVEYQKLNINNVLDKQNLNFK